MLYALCDLKPWEELILDYGPDYWKVMAKVLLEAHAKVWERAYARCSAIKKELLRRGVRESLIRNCEVKSLAEVEFWNISEA